MNKNRDSSPILYTALFVDDQQALLAMFPARHAKVFAHHSTIEAYPTSLEGLEVGKKTNLKIIGEAADERCYVLLVENRKSKNPIPHITVSCSDDFPPKRANEMLTRAAESGSITYFPEPFFIAVTEGYMNREGSIVTS